MMEVSFDDMITRIKEVDLHFQVEESFNDTAKQFLEKQRDQLFAGQLSTGEPIQPPYAAGTVRIKKKKGQPTDRVTLKDTGSFYQEQFLDVREKDLVIDSADPKSDELQKKYGQDIFGLTPKNEDDYIEEALDPVFQGRIQNALDL